MKALIYHGPGMKSWEEKPFPVILHPTDAIVRITNTTICGTDLHILKGDVPEVKKGITLGHEGVGTIESVGPSVSGFKPGDHVLISCITSCAVCAACRKGMYSQCENGGWILGHLIDGTQAEFVRIPYASTSLHHIPAGSDEEALVMLSDILPTGYECGVLNGVVQPGDTLAIVGAGPVGLAALLTAQFYSPAEIIMIDPDVNRLETAMRFGASHTINNSKEDPVIRVMAITESKGVDTVIEAVGLPVTFELCQNIVATGGHIANVGVHGAVALLHLETLWSRNIGITTQLVDTSSTPLLLKMLRSKKLDAAKLITHRFPLDQIEKAYEVFQNAGQEKALKVLLKAG